VLSAFFVEMAGTGMLVVVIFACTDEANSSRPRELVAVTIGLTVTVLISLFGPLTMAGLNPARDFGPRVFSAMAGWGNVPFATNGRGWFTVYILAPMIGGLLGGGFYRRLLAPLYVAGASKKAT
jgi:glycerol uptake facilitator-like aquaporin